MIHQKNWHKNFNFDVSSNLKAWLQHKGSFMERLKNHGVLDAKIEIIHESWQMPKEDEKALLKVQSETWIREVWITSENKFWMFARTIIPRTLLNGKLTELTDLKTRPIGSILFQDKNIQRGEFEFLCLDSTHDMYNKIQGHARTHVFARRSLFYRAHASLLLTEIFMPDIENLEVMK